MDEQFGAQSAGVISLEQIRADYANLQAAHSALLTRIQEDGDERNDKGEQAIQIELQQLRNRIKELEQSLSIVTTERDDLNSTVRDLRVRVEESRRAIMRLQGQGTQANGSNSSSSSSAVADQLSGGLSANGMPVVASQKQEARRSMNPSVLASWNPREMGAGLGVVTTTAPSPTVEDFSETTHTPEELAELRKSKRASLAFGPYAAHGSMARRAQGHRRIASGSRIGTEDNESQPMPPPPPSAGGGLRGLHLGANAASPSPGTTSKRASVIGAGGLFRSPASDTLDLPPTSTTPGDESPEKSQGLAATVSSLLMPSRATRRTSNSSSVSGGLQAREEADTAQTLTLPRSTSRLSQSPSQASITSPILESKVGDEDFVDEPLTARATLSSFTAQQSTGLSSLQLQRSLMESKVRLRDRDEQVAQMKREMQTMRMQLDEARDARIASEACLTALRNFVKLESQREGDEESAGVDVLRGVKLPPLPTDQDTDESEPHRRFSQLPTSASASAPSAWRSLGSTLAGLSSRKATVDVDGKAEVEKGPTATPDGNAGAFAQQNLQTPVSPATQLTSSFGGLWSRSTTVTPGGRDGVPIEAAPSDGADGVGDGLSVSSRHASLIAQPAGNGAANDSGASPTAGFKAFNWFAKRTISNASDAASSTNTSGAPTGSEPLTPTASAAIRVSSPPFANLDNHVLTLDQINSPATRRSASYASLTGGSSISGSRHASLAGGSANGEMEPNGRVRKAMEMSEAVDEDTGFVPPSF